MPTSYTMRHVITSRKYEINKACINIILVGYDDLKKYISEYFDFSCCQTFFDGYCLNFWEYTHDKIAYIVNDGSDRKESEMVAYDEEQLNNHTHPY